MIAASALLVVVALVLLIVGVFQTGLEMIFGSMAASVLAAITLLTGVLKDRKRPATAGASYASFDPGERTSGGVLVLDEQAAETDVSTAEDASATLVTPATEETPSIAVVDDEPTLAPEDVPTPAPAERATRSGAAKKTTARKPAAKPAAAKKTTARAAGTAKAAPKKAAPKKAAPPKSAAKKPAAKKSVAKKPVAKKPAARKPSPRKPAGE